MREEDEFVSLQEHETRALDERGRRRALVEQRDQRVHQRRQLVVRERQLRRRRHRQ